MTPVRILIVQLDDADPPGKLADWFTDAGADLHILHADTEAVPATAEGFAAVVCLGMPMGANDDLRYPWLADVRKLLAVCVTTRVPLLAICGGAQLLAVATGGRVETGDQGPEVGAVLVGKRDIANEDPLFGELPMMPDVLQFHSDVITRLPAGAVLMMAGTKYDNQAFRIGSCAYAIQFHIETTPEIVRRWADASPDVAALARPGHLDDERLAEAHADIEEIWRPFADRFVRMANGEIAPAAPRLQML